MRLKLISCEVFAREVAALLRENLPHAISVTFLSKGMHELEPRSMSAELQAAIDRTSSQDFDAILLGYGLCRYGTVGLRSRQLPLVLPRIHDCISMLLGSHARYLRYFEQHPATYFRSSGWLERRRNPERLQQLSVAERHGLNASDDERRTRYGPEAGNYLNAILGLQRKHYSRLAFIQMGIEPDDRFQRESQVEAAAEGWQFETLPGDLGLLRKLLRGEWEGGEFLVVQPGGEIRPSYDGSVVCAGSAVSQEGQ